MYKDPYKVLNVPRNATPEQIKKAYRMMSRKYHPDAHVGKDDAKEAEEKFKEVQEAYERIQSNRFSSYGGDNSYRYYQGSGAVELQSVVNLIHNGRYDEALLELEKIENRNAEWYYLSAIANIGCGYFMRANEHATIAYKLEPDNIMYQHLFEQLGGRTNFYTSRTFGYGNSENSGGLCAVTGNLFLCYLLNMGICCCR